MAVRSIGIAEHVAHYPDDAERHRALDSARRFYDDNAAEARQRLGNSSPSMAHGPSSATAVKTIAL